MNASRYLGDGHEPPPSVCVCAPVSPLPISPPLLTRAVRSRRHEALERGLWVITIAVWIDVIAWLVARLYG
jgi:hypothetical protein